MNERAIENHRLVMLAKAAAQHQVDGDPVEYATACGLLVDMARAEMQTTSKGIAERLAAEQTKS